MSDKAESVNVTSKRSAFLIPTKDLTVWTMFHSFCRCTLCLSPADIRREKVSYQL